MRARAVFAVLVALILAGCLAPKDSPGVALSTPVFSDVVAEAFPMEMDDGVTLDTWLYRPQGAGDARLPIILMQSPYYGNLDPALGTGGQKFSEWLIDFFVPRGYAIVLQSVRGTGASEGCFSMGGLREMQDARDVVEALAAEPWSNGKVAMTGKSYRGTTPHMAAILDTPHLATILPIAGITDWYNYTRHDGATYLYWENFNSLYIQSVSLNQGSSGDEPARTDTVPGVVPLLPGRLCPDTVGALRSDRESATTGDYTAYFEERNYARDVAKVKAPVYVIHGLQDWNVKPDQIVDWYNAVNVPKRLVLGQWEHEMPDRVDWGDDVLRWLDRYLKGVENGIENTPPVYVEDSDKAWRTENEWPPARAVESRLALADGGKLVAGAGSGAFTFVTDPVTQPGPEAGSGASQLVFETEPLAETLRTSGAPRVVLSATVTGANAQINVLLYETPASGEARLVNCGALDARHRESARQSAPVTPMPAEYRVRLQPQEHVFHPGSKITLVVAGANPAWFVPEKSRAAVAIDGAASYLSLPTISGVTLEAPQPVTKAFEDLPWTSSTPERKHIDESVPRCGIEPVEP